VTRPAGAGTLFFVGPDNGLLVAAAEAAAEAPVARAVELAVEPVPPDRGATFDGRDVFAPAAAALCAGVRLDELGEEVDPASLVRLMGGVVEHGRLGDGRSCLRAEVTWVDRFGNLQLAATVADARVAGLPAAGSIELVTGASGAGGRDEPSPDQLPRALVPEGVQLRCVAAYGDLKHGELGLLVDANGHVAVVAGEASAAHWLNVLAGELLVLAW
jgi:S-adenosylmethionine hydrolase